MLTDFFTFPNNDTTRRATTLRPLSLLGNNGKNEKINIAPSTCRSFNNRL